MSEFSTASSVSVSLNGDTMDLETALDSVVRDLQKHLNLVQMNLRSIGLGEERNDSFEEQILEADNIQNSILEMNFLFNSLYDMAYQIVGDPQTKEEKSWLKTHKAERKVFIAKMKADNALKEKLEKASQKESKKTAQPLENKMEE